MTIDELNAIVQAVMLELEKAGVDFDFKAETPQADDLVYVMRGTADKYQGITVKWQNLLDIIVKKATDAKDEAVSAKDIALETLATIQGIESNVSLMKSSVDASEANVASMKASVEASEANVTASETRVTQIKAEAEQTLAEATQTVAGKADKTYVDGELAKKADITYVDGKLATKADKSELAVERARIDSLSTLPEGSTTGDAELIDLRIGADGVTYENAGSAVRTQISDLKGDLVDLSDNVGFILTNRKKVVSTSAGGYISVFDSLSFKKQMKYTFVLSFSPTTNADTYFYLTENGSNIVSKGINSGTTEYSFDYVPTSDKEGIVARWYCNSPNIECMAIMSVEQEKLSSKVYDAVEKSTKVYSVIEKDYFETYDYVEQTVSLESNYINSVGNSTSGYNHIAVANVKFGEKYKFKNKVGANLVAYVIKNANGKTTRAYTSEDWLTTHDYDVEIEVAESENGGTIYINTADENFIGLKKYEAYFKKKTSLYGKKLSVAGDSICAGAGYLGGYGKIIADLNNMTLQNVGIGGSTITDYASDRGKICNMISQLNSDADYVLVNGGVNDASLGVPIGTMTDRFDSTYDKTTFIGAMESICKELTNKFNGKKIAFILVHKMTNKYSNFYTGEDNYYIAQKKVLEKWGIPYVDLNVTTPPLNYISSLANVYTNNGDGWHPNYLGYTTFYIPKILSLLESI